MSITASKMIFFDEKKNLKIYFESQNFAILDNFYSTDCKGLVVGFEPKGRPDRMRDSVN